MKIADFHILFHKIQSLALAKLYHTRVILSMFYFFAFKRLLVGASCSHQNEIFG